MISKKDKILISKNGTAKIYFLFFSSIFVVFLEMLGIGSVPMFAYILIEPQSSIIELLRKFNYPVDNFDLSKKNMIIISGVIFFSIFLLKNISLILIKYYELKIMRDLREQCTNKLFVNYINLPFAFHLDTNPSTILRTISADIGHAFNVLLSKIKLYREVLLVLIILIVLVAIEPVIYGLTFLVFTFIAILFYFFYKKVLKKRSQIQIEKNAERYQLLNQTFSSIKEIKIFNRKKFFIDVFSKNISILESISLVTTFVSQIPRIVYEVLAISMIIFFTTMLVLMDTPQNTIIPIVSLLVASGARFIPAFNVIASSMSGIRFSQPGFNHVIKILKSLQEDQYNTEENNENNLKKIIFNKKIEMKNISFFYGSKKILDNINFEIEKSSTVGIIGSSGEGKSTLINILLGLLKPSSGNIFSDGVNIEDNLKSWQKKIGYISQDLYLMDDTIKSNICFGVEEKNIDQSRFNNAIKLAQIEDFINSLQNKEMTKIGNLGSRISGGQKQRIAIARALYINPEILVIDEGTSSLDLDNENKIMEEINKIKRDKTIIIVSHRPNALTYCDKIYSIANKQISIKK